MDADNKNITNMDFLNHRSFHNDSDDKQQIMNEIIFDTNVQQEEDYLSWTTDCNELSHTLSSNLIIDDDKFSNDSIIEVANINEKEHKFRKQRCDASTNTEKNHQYQNIKYKCRKPRWQFRSKPYFKKRTNRYYNYNSYRPYNYSNQYNYEYYLRSRNAWNAHLSWKRQNDYCMMLLERSFYFFSRFLEYYFGINYY